MPSSWWCRTGAGLGDAGPGALPVALQRVQQLDGRPAGGAAWCWCCGIDAGPSMPQHEVVVPDSSSAGPSMPRPGPGAVQMVRLVRVLVRPSIDAFLPGAGDAFLPGAGPGAVQMVMPDSSHDQVMPDLVRVLVRPSIDAFLPGAGGAGTGCRQGALPVALQRVHQLDGRSAGGAGGAGAPWCGW